MESDGDIEFSDYEIEDLFQSSMLEERGGRSEVLSKNEALDQSTCLFWPTCNA